jgi:integrase
MLKKQGYREGTIREYANQIALLNKYGADIFNPESVKSVLAQANWKESTKAVITKIYSNFLSFHDLTWHEPTYKQRKTLKFIPTEKEINDLISCCGKITSLALRIAKETGARIGEIAKLRWIDIDQEKRILRISEAEKGSNPRILSISNDLIAALDHMQKKGEYVFMTNGKPMVATHLSGLLLNGRKTAARKLTNPRLLEISFHTMRHWKATMEYHKTRDILHVKEVLGHKCIENTMIYIDMEKALFREGNEDFIVKAAANLDEACKLLEVGFEYVCEMDGKKLFRKRN